MSKEWIWEKVINIERDGIMHHFKFQTEELFIKWNEGIESQRFMSQEAIWNKERTKIFVWYFESDAKKLEFIRAFKESINKIQKKV